MNKCQGDGFSSMVHEQVPLSSQCLVFRIDGDDFLHCWVTYSIWLDHAESLIINNSFHGSLFRALTNSRAVLRVNNSLIFVTYGMLLLGLLSHYHES